MILRWRGQEGAYTLVQVSQDLGIPEQSFTGPTHEDCLRQMFLVADAGVETAIGYIQALLPEHKSVMQVTGLPTVQLGEMVCHYHHAQHFLEPLDQICDCVLTDAAWTDAGQLCPCGDYVWHAERVESSDGA